MVGFMQPHDDGKRSEDFPQNLPILPLRNTVAFPFLILPMAIGLPRSIKLIEDELVELPKDVRQSLTFITVHQISEALEAALELKIPAFRSRN